MYSGNRAYLRVYSRKYPKELLTNYCWVSGQFRFQCGLKGGPSWAGRPGFCKFRCLLLFPFLDGAFAFPNFVWVSGFHRLWANSRTRQRSSWPIRSNRFDDCFRISKTRRFLHRWNSFSDHSPDTKFTCLTTHSNRLGKSKKRGKMDTHNDKKKMDLKSLFPTVKMN